MNKRALDALNGSIEKWTKIVNGTGGDQGSANCPLCREFIENKKCHGCPVAEKTGVDRCYLTPYDAWWRNRDNLDDNNSDYLKFATDDFEIRIAREELAFLKSLLPKTSASKTVAPKRAKR